MVALTERSAAILGPELIGVYAAGSLALAAYQPGRSDIDVAVVCTNALLHRPAKEAIVQALRHVRWLARPGASSWSSTEKEVAAAGGGAARVSRWS